jgi:hypothetical protein
MTTPNEIFYSKALRDGGLTVNIFNHKSPTEGFMISLKGFEREVHSVEELDDYIVDNIQALKKDWHYLGLWVSDGVMIADVSTNSFNNEQECLLIARHRDQKAIYDVINKKVIFV